MKINSILALFLFTLSGSVIAADHSHPKTDAHHTDTSEAPETDAEKLEKEKAAAAEAAPTDKK
jgi:hypothetical protein